MSVTTAGMTRRARLPRRRVLAAILAVSLALNLCVVAGAVWSRLHAPPQTTSERFHRLADSLNLTSQQRVAFDNYVAAMAARGERMRQDVEPMMDAAWAEIAKPDADPARVLQLLDDAGNRRRAFQHEAVAETLTLMATLTPEQRAKFIADEREHFSTLRRRRAEEQR